MNPRFKLEENLILKILKKRNLNKMTVEFTGGFMPYEEIALGMCGQHTVGYKDGIELSDEEDEMLVNHLERNILDEAIPRWDTGVGETGTKVSVTIMSRNKNISYLIEHTEIMPMMVYDEKGKRCFSKSEHHERNRSFMY